MIDSDFLWHTLGGGAIITAALTLARLILDYGLRAGERRAEQRERRHRQDRDAEARLERILQDRLADSDRRLERSDADVRAERVRAATLEHDLARLQHAYEVLRVEYASLLEQEEGRGNTSAGGPAGVEGARAAEPKPSRLPRRT